MNHTLLIKSMLLACVVTALPAPSQAQAQSDAGIGRLFHTPAERQALDASRRKPASNMAATAAAPDDQAPPMGRPAAMTTDAMGGGPPPGQPGYQAAGAPAHPPGMAAAQEAAQETAPSPASEQLQLNGVLRTSSGRSTVWLNNVPQSGTANKFSNRNSKALTVTLPSGRRIVLQPGQRYDLAEGRVKDINEP